MIKISNQFLIKFKRSKLIKILFKVIFRFFSLLPKNNQMVIFESFGGKQFSDNPRAIYEYLKQKYPSYKMYWTVNKHFMGNFKDKDLNILIKYSPRWILGMCRSKYWVTNSRLPLWVYKSKNTVYLQTWHGTPLKKLALDMTNVYIANQETDPYKETFIQEASRWDYLISPNPYSSHIFKKAFNFNNHLLEVGYPRNDFLINHNTGSAINKIKKDNSLPTNKKIILYAPTWRDDDHKDGKYIFKLELDLKKMKEVLGNNYIVLLRLHYSINDKIDLSPHNGFAYNFSDYEDIKDLFLISDFLITDYSSVFFDFAILKKPIIFFMYDIEHYRDTLRGFYFDIEDFAPELITKTTDGVIQMIKDLNESPNQATHIGMFQDFISLEDGKASERVVEKVFSHK